MLGKIEGKRRRQKRMRWLDSVTDWMNGHEPGQTLGDSEGRGRLACYSLWGCKESDTNWQRVRHKLIHKLGLFQCKLRFPLSRNPVEIRSRRVWSCVASNGKSSSDSLLNTPVIPPYLQLFSLNVLHETLALGDTDTCYGARERCHKK